MSQTTGLGMEGTVATSTASGDDEETTSTSTIITTAVTTVQPPGQLLAGSDGGPLDSSLCVSVLACLALWQQGPTHREHVDWNQTQVQILTGRI